MNAVPDFPSRSGASVNADSRTGDRREHPGRPSGFLAVFGGSCVVLGGLVAAVTGPLGLADGSWVAAYLVLVGGVAQYAMGRMPYRLAAPSLSLRLSWAEPVCWNLGNVLVVVGTLAGLPALVDVGSVFLLVVLGIAWHAVRDAAPVGRVARFAGWAYREVLILLVLSIPVGAVLAHLRG